MCVECASCVSTIMVIVNDNKHTHSAISPHILQGKLDWRGGVQAQVRREEEDSDGFEVRD